jgi:hypothetical protein
VKPTPKVGSTEVFGIFSAVTLMVDGRDSLTKVLAPFASCCSLNDAVHRILTLSDLEFAGWLFYSVIFLSAVTGLIFGSTSLMRRWVKRREQWLIP